MENIWGVLEQRGVEKDPIQNIKHLYTLQSNIFFGLRHLEMFCCKGYLIALQEFKRNEERVQRT